MHEKVYVNEVATRHAGSEDEKQALDLLIKLSRAWDSVERMLSAALDAADLTISQFGILDALYHLGPLSLGQLAKKHLKSPNNMTSVVDTMERSGLVARERQTSDRRVIVAQLTDKGRELYERTWPNHLDAIVRSMAVLSGTEQATLSRLLRKLGKDLASKR
jgi:MarR family 2-MHQ and catechol resistance regulon transcriptional repressor